LKLISKKIKTCGIENTYNQLFFHLVIFCGEYIREKKDGHWEIQTKESYPNEIEPTFVDGNDHNYHFEEMFF
jgi:hypothetical protein